MPPSYVTEYSHGWGDKCVNPQKVKCTWDLLVEDINRKPTMMTFDLVEGEYPSILGLDIKRYSDTINIST